MTPPDVTARLFASGGEMGELMHETDWAATPLGDVQRWPTSLVSVLGICLGSSFPIAIYWGSRLSLLYNQAWSPILGSKHPWALGHDARDVWPEIWNDIGPLFEHVLSTGEATYTEDGLLPMRRHGYTEECYFNFTFTPVRGDTGQVEGVFNAVVETTYRVVSERRARLLRDLAARVPAARSVEEVCRSAVDMLAAATRDVPFCALYATELGQTRAQRIASAGMPEVVSDEAWQRTAADLTGDIAVVDGLASRLGAAFGGGAWPEASDTAFIAPLTASGKPLGFLILGKNPRRAYDDEYRQFVERVSAIIATALANVRAYAEERRRAEALAELDRAKTVFFANISHEFRTPLTLMLGPTEDALASAERALRGESLETVYRNELRLLKLVNTLLEFSRIEAGRMQAAFEPTELAALTAEFASMFRATVERAGLSLIVDCPALPELVYVDRGMWEKIVLNLISNAFKFTFEGEIRVSLSVRGTQVELEVSDTGVGIPKAELPRVFERFHRIEGTRARTHEGSGIGLALVHDLVALHGGTIAVTSSEGVGTQFRVALPLGCEHLPADRVGETAPDRQSIQPIARSFVTEADRWLSEPSAERKSERNGGASVLVADDNADVREYLLRVLRPHFAVQVVDNGAQALAAALAQPPDVVLTDVMMPELDGFGLLRELRANPSTARVPVIMLSARSGEESRIEGLQAGADDYLSKPFSARELIARIETHVQLTGLRKASESERQRLYELCEQVPVAITVFEGSPLQATFRNRLARESVHRTEPTSETARDRLTRVFETGVDELIEEEPVRVEGDADTRYLTVHIQPLRDASGAVIGVVSVGYEVTQQVKSRQAAQAASRAKDEFLAILGHELRNPLSPMVTALQLLRERGQHAREHAIIERQVNHLTRLVDDLLDVSRITRGKVELRKQPLELSQPFQRGLEMTSPLLEQRRQHVQAEVPSEGLPIEGDPDRLAQVVSNLLTNAAKYSDTGTTIRVLASRLPDAVELRVIDQGIGLAPEMLEKAFDLFVQHPQALDRASGGLGLGLPIVRSLVQMHGGTVAAHSAGLGRGSEFVVRLPLRSDAGQSQVRRAHGGALPERTSKPPRAPLRVLLVDDNRDAAEMMSEMLRTRGHTVAVAHDGPSALEAARFCKPAVCILDIGLPVMDGYELAQRLRDSGDLPGDARLIALTGYGSEADRKRSTEARFSAHLVKPVKLETLERVLVDDSVEVANPESQPGHPSSPTR